MEYKKVPVVNLRLVVRGGSADDPDGLEGVASVSTSLMREGTTTRSATELAKAFDFLGGSLSTGAGLDYCAVNGEVLKKDIDTELELFADVVLNPVFPEEELEREQKQRLADLEALKEDPGSVADRVFTKTVYGSHAYGRKASKASLTSLTRDYLVEFYQQHFVPNNSILVVVGDFDSREMLSKVTSKFSAWKQGERNQHTLSLPQTLHGRTVLLVNKPDATQTQIRIGNIGIDVKNPDNFAIEVASGLFGGGFTSRLEDELRVKRSLTYGVGSGFSSNLFGGTYSISTFTKNETVGKTADVVLEELKKFRDQGARNDEVVKAQNYLAGGFARGLQRPEALAASITDIELYGYPSDYLSTYIQKLKAVTPGDVQRIAKQYFLLDDLLFVFVGPAREIIPLVQKYGSVNVMELNDAVQ